MEGLSLQNIVSLIVGATAMLGGILAWRKFRSEETAGGVTAAFNGYNNLTTMLIAEREAREKAVNQLTERVTRQDAEIGQLKEELAERGELLVRLRADISELWGYSGNLETLMREANLTLPVRPTLFEVPPDNIGKQPKRGRKP